MYATKLENYDIPQFEFSHPVSYYDKIGKSKCLPKRSPNERNSRPVKPAIVKKADNKYGNEVLKCLLSPNHLPNSCGDRFIPRRYAIGTLSKFISSFNLMSSTENNDIFKLKNIQGYWRLHNHNQNILSNIGMDVSQTVLCFHDPITSSECVRTHNNLPRIESASLKYRNIEELDWACKPRPVPMAFNDSTHDLPEFHKYSYANIISWSNSGKIAAAFGQDLVLWGPPSGEGHGSGAITMVYKLSTLSAVTFNFGGDLLAVGSQSKRQLQIWDVRNTGGITEVDVYRFSRFVNDFVTAIEWDTTGESIICGMESGKVHLFKFSGDPTLTLLRTVVHHEDRIRRVKYSSKKTFVAIVDFGGLITIWKHERMELFYERQGIDLFDWHQWNETDILIGKKK